MLNNITNFFNLIKSKRIKTELESEDLIAIGTRQSKSKGDYKPTAIKFEDLRAQLGGGSNGTGIGGTQYIFVQANGTDVENAAELQAAYNTAKTMSPKDNRITVVAAPGTYKFPSTFVMDTEYIDLVSLTGNRDVVFDLDGITDPFQFDDDTSDIISIGECLLIDTDNVFVKGVKGKFYLSSNWNSYWGEGEDYILPIQVSDNLPNIIVENCEGGTFSFGGDITFGSNPIELSGTFINCKTPAYAFCGEGILSGVFIDCIGGDSSFGFRGVLSGTFTNCIGGNESFGGFGTASGTFTNCQGGEGSFGGAGIASGTFTNCIGSTVSFGSQGTASGTFTNCICTNFGFGSFGTLSGKLFYCRLTSGTFETVSGGGRTYYCVDGNGDPNNQ